MNPAAIHWNSVSFTIREGFWLKQKNILRQMELFIPEGAVVGIVGPNGAGKTTALKLGAGLLKPSGGNILISGLPASNPEVRAGIGLLTETPYIYPYLRLREWLVMLGGFSGLKGRVLKRKTDEMLERFSLAALSGQYMRTLSKGQLQRAGLAQVFIHDPDLFLLDEPMSGLDPFWRQWVQNMLLELKQAGKTIIFSSHILSDVERLCDKVALIESGKLKWFGQLSDISRDVKTYIIVCTADTEEILTPFAETGSLEKQPGGEYRLRIKKERKKELLDMASKNGIDLISIQPFQQEIEENLFQFMNAEDNRGEG